MRLQGYYCIVRLVFGEKNIVEGTTSINFPNATVRSQNRTTKETFFLTYLQIMQIF